MTLQRLYWVFLVIAIAAIGMASFVLKWTVVEPQKSKEKDTKQALVGTPVKGGAVAGPAVGGGEAVLLNKAPILPSGNAPPGAVGSGNASSAVPGGSGSERLREFFAAAGREEAVRVESFALRLNEAELEELADRALRFADVERDRMLAIQVLAAAVGNGPRAIDPLKRVALGKLPPNAEAERLAVERRVRLQAIQGLANYEPGRPGAVTAEAVLVEIAEAVGDPVLRELARNSSAKAARPARGAEPEPEPVVQEEVAAPEAATDSAADTTTEVAPDTTPVPPSETEEMD